MSTHLLTEAGDILATEAGDQFVTEDSVADGALLAAYPDPFRDTAATSGASPFDADSRLVGGGGSGSVGGCG